MTIFWTRPAADWEEDQKIFQGNKDVVSLPFTEQIKIEVPQEINPRKYAGLVLTSKKALHFSDIKDGSEWFRCFCVGEETTKFAQSLGFQDVSYPFEAHGGIGVLNMLVPAKKPYLWLRGKDVAHDLQTLGAAKNLKIESLTTYETQKIKFNKAQIARIASHADPHRICVASPFAAEVLAEHLRHFRSPWIFSIGETTAEKLREFGISSRSPSPPSLEKVFKLALQGV